MKNFLLVFLALALTSIALYPDYKTFDITAYGVDLIKVLDEKNIKYKYKEDKKELDIENETGSIRLKDGKNFYFIGQKKIKADPPKGEEKSFYVGADIFSEISKNIFTDDITDDIIDIKAQNGKLTIIDNKVAQVSKKTYKNNAVELVIIDAGHGGKDPGSIGANKLYEKTVTLEMAKALEKELGELLPKVEVVMTRSDDTFLSLQERSKIANVSAKLNTDKPKNALFISIHCNASFNKEAKGFEIYFLSSQESSEYARAVSLMENSVAIDFEKIDSSKYTNYTDTTYNYMLIEQYQKESRILSEHIADGVMKIKELDVRQVPVQSALFYVLKGSIMPAVLIEMGFITNPKEAKIIQNKNFQKEMARNIAKSIEKYSKDLENTKGYTK